MSHSYDVGTRAWQPDATEGWVASEVVKKTVDGDKVTLVFKLENEEVCEPGVDMTSEVVDSQRSSPLISNIDQDDRALSGGSAKCQRPVVTTSHEPDHARSQ